MLEIDRLFLKEGYLLGIQMSDAERRADFFFRVLSVEECPYQYSFAALAAAANSGWVRPQDSSNRYILEAPETTLVNHFFTGVFPTRAEIYLQYPLDRDKNTLLGTRTVGSGIGIFADGKRSPYYEPSPRTELVSIKDIGPAFCAYSPIACTPKVYFHAVQYRVSAPLIPTEEERKKARIIAIYGKTLVACPNWLVGKGVEV